MRRFIRLFMAMLLAVISTGCGKKAVVSDDTEFMEFISSYPQNKISRHAAIRIVLAHPSEKAKPGQREEENLFSLSPKVEGSTYWLDNRTLEFQPSSLLEREKEYQVTFELGKVAELNGRKEFEQFVFPIEVVRQDIHVTSDEPQMDDEGEYFVTGVVALNDKEDLADVQSCFSAQMKEPTKKTLDIEWTESASDYNPQYAFTIKGFGKNIKKDIELTLEWDGKKISCEAKDKIDIKIPYIAGMKVTNLQVVNGEQAYLKLFFSKSIRPNQSWRTYVNIKDENVSYMREGNVLKIFPEKISFQESSLNVYSGLMSVDGEKVERDTVLKFCFSSLKPAVRLVKTGVILPSSEKATLPFQAVNLKSVDVSVIKIFENNMLQYLQSNNMNETSNNELKRTARLLFQKKVDLEADNATGYSQWRTYSLDLSQLAKEDPGAMYRVVFSFKRAYSTYPCEITDSINDIDHDYSGVEGIEDNGSDSYYWDYYDEGYSYSGDYAYVWDERDDPSKITYYLDSEKRVTTNIFVSNFGITAKGGKSNIFDVIVTNILTATPESGVVVKFYDYQMQFIDEDETDKDGFVKKRLSRSPSFIVVEKDGRMGYLRVRDNTALSLSSFDVSGVKSSKGVKGYIYGERGVWRPGDTLNISLMVQDADGSIPAGHPITMDLTTPRGQRYAHMVQKYDPSNYIYSFRIPTLLDDQTGVWHISFAIGGSTFQKSLSVETVKPNRLKVQLNTRNPVLSVGSSEEVSVHSEWLHGGVAADKDVNITMRYRRNPNPFPKYSDYLFESPNANDFTSEETTVLESSTDGNGNVTEHIHIPELSNAPGMLQATFTTRVDEGTGDNSVNYKNIPLSPYSRYVGVRYPIKPDYKYVFTNRDQTFPIVLLDENGKPISGDGISFKLYKLQWHWWWDSNASSDAYYSESTSRTPYFEKKNIRVSEGRATVTVNVPDKDWGRYLLVVKDGKNGHEVGSVIFFDWENWYSRAQSEGSTAATLLSFKLDKETYIVGEKVKVTVPTPEKGRLLVTVENRSKVLTSRWVEAQSGNTVVELDVTPEMLPNAYVYVNLLQPYNKTENDLPIRMYGVKNFMVESSNSRLTPVIKMDDKVESDKEFEVAVSEKDGKEMCYTLAIVDEGLLDLTNFKTPNAHDEFFKREALGVNTWDVYDLIIGAYGGKIEQVLAIGGDQALNRDGMNKRFEPVVRFIGPISLKKGETKKHKVTLPTYFGSVRVMVVAGNNAAYGNAEKAVKVTKPLMILPTAPRVIGPNEEFSVPVSVFAMDGNKKNVTVSISAGDKADIIGKSSIQESFNVNEDKILTFKLRARPVIGKNKITITATDGTNNVKSEINLDVRNPNERIQKSKMFEIPGNQEITCPYDLFGMENTNQLMVEISSMPSLDLGRSLEYLIGYPHGCAEQTSSKAFPQLLLPEIIEMTPQEKSDCDKHVKEAIFKLSQMQMSSGAFSYWMGGNYDYPWATTYAGHFLLEAKNHGFDVSNSVINNFLAYQKREASSWTYKDNSENTLVQAYRLYTLALAGKADLSAMNRLKDKTLDNVSKWRLAAAYALCGKKDVAKNLCAALSSDVRSYTYSNITFGSSLRDRALILDAMTLTDADKTATFTLLRQMSEQLSKGKQYSTQELAQVLIAFAHYSKQFKDGGINAACIKDGKSVAFNSNNNVAKKSIEATGTGLKSLKIKNNGANTLFASVVTSGIPIENAGGAFQNGLNMSVSYTDMNGYSIEPSNLSQGTDFKVKVTISNTSSYETYKEVALTQVFPSGWEIRNERLSGTTDESENYNYKDVRDDRVMTYFSLAPRQTKTFIVKLHASFVGKYFAPGFLCTSMYDSDISARNLGGWVVVSE